MNDYRLQMLGAKGGIGSAAASR